ncbi:AP-4-A phosphorylase [bioreactor metagenome]|uniref:AP-4-A phosphorylase n=1 Tax=bioreactor metagenome TaxID=1076179 RepID=A0A645GQ25_9ZZZZ
MNKYPYNSGHTLVVPLRHISNFEDLESDELTSIMLTVQEVITAMKQAFNPHGFNVGINIGTSAGAGLPGHLHFHIVPRWNGDSNFTATIADIKIVSSAIEDTRLQLSALLNK